MAPLKGKVETEIEIKAPAEKFYNIFRSRAHHVPNISSGSIQRVQVHEGDWETHGSIKSWNYSVGKVIYVHLTCCGVYIFNSLPNKIQLCLVK